MSRGWSSGPSSAPLLGGGGSHSDLLPGRGSRSDLLLGWGSHSNLLPGRGSHRLRSGLLRGDLLHGGLFSRPRTPNSVGVNIRGYTTSLSN